MRLTSKSAPDNSTVLNCHVTLSGAWHYFWKTMPARMQEITETALNPALLLAGS